MKNLKFLSLITILSISFFVTGCYTQLAVKDSIPDDKDIVTNEDPNYNDEYYEDVDDTLNTENDYYYDDGDPNYNISLSLGYLYPRLGNMYRYRTYPYYSYRYTSYYFDPYYYCWDPYSIFCYPDNYFYYPNYYGVNYYHNYFYNYGYNNYGYFYGYNKYKQRNNAGYKLRNNSGIRGKTYTNRDVRTRNNNQVLLETEIIKIILQKPETLIEPEKQKTIQGK